jgi:hypothetical protein
VYPLGDLTLQFTKDYSKAAHLIKQSISYQDRYMKPSPKSAVIETNIFGSEECKWVSAILFSKVEVSLLLNHANDLPDINWNEPKNDFVLFHNPFAQYPLSKDLFNSATHITIEQDKLICKGRNIFPLLKNLE